MLRPPGISAAFLALLCVAAFLLRHPAGAQSGLYSVADSNFQAGASYYAGEAKMEAEEVFVPRGSVQGIVVDEDGAPVQGVEVELIPTDKTGDQRWYATKSDWTNRNGEYEFKELRTREYLLAVQVHAGPDGRHPFAGVYYPDAEEEAAADHIFIEPETLQLAPVRLRRIPTKTLNVTVMFEDGTRPQRSNLLFYNPSFPEHAVIGDEAPEILDGQGQITVPTGFEYYARAKVDCDAGPTIGTRESRPVLQISVGDGLRHQEVKFVIPGPACKLWSPK